MTFPRPPRTAALLALAAAAGCNSLETTTPARLAPEPRGTLTAATTQPAGDVAIGTELPVRNWSRSSAEYQNGDTVSGSTGVRYLSDVGQLFGKGGRTTRSDVVSSSGGVGASGTTPMGGALASGGTGAGTGSAGASASAGPVAGAGTGVGPTVPANVGVGSTGARGATGATPAVASGSTVNGQIVRGDGSIVPAGTPGAAGTPGSIGVAPGSVSATVASPDVGAVSGNAVDASTSASSVTAPQDAGFTGREQAIAAASLPFVETGVFFANVVTSPLTFWQQRDGIRSGGLEIPPSYTAMPALPYEKPRKAPRVAPPAVAAPAVPLVPTGVYPTTNPAATDVTSVLPTTAPVTPLKPTTKPTSMKPAEVPIAQAVTATADVKVSGNGPARKPGSLKRAAEVSPTAFVIAGTAPYAGRYEVEPNLTLDAALRGAGVLPADASSVTVSVQRRGAAPAAKVPLATLRTRAGDESIVKAGDVITVSSAR